MSEEALCHHCDAPATRLCDFTLGYATDKDVISLKDERITCDRPLCDSCARQVGWTTLGGFDTIDRCRDHAECNERPRPGPLRQLLAEKRRLQVKTVAGPGTIEALRPFADFAVDLERCGQGRQIPDSCPMGGPNLDPGTKPTMGDCRRAAAIVYGGNWKARAEKGEEHGRIPRL